MERGANPSMRIFFLIRLVLLMVFLGVPIVIAQRLGFNPFNVKALCHECSPEGLKCVEPMHHEGLHIPKKGRGWAWG